MGFSGVTGLKRALVSAAEWNLPLLQTYRWQISLVALSLIGLIVLLAVTWRWFRKNRDALIARGSEYWLTVSERYPVATRFVAARFARGHYLGLHLTIGFVMSVAGLWLFAGVTEDVLNHDPLTRVDLAIATWIRGHSTPLGDTIFSAVSLAGSPVAMAAIGIAGATLIALRRNWATLGAWVAAFAGAGALTVLLKIIIRRPRPTGAAAFLHGETFSFPSGHSLGSLVGYGMLAFVLWSFWLQRRKKSGLLALGTAVLIVSIGVSRLYLGVHYFSDVVAGYAAGMLWLSTCISGLQMVERKRLVISSTRASPDATVERSLPQENAFSDHGSS